jgi:murein L,D-transpeptidase YafK
MKFLQVWVVAGLLFLLFATVPVSAQPRPFSSAEVIDAPDILLSAIPVDAKKNPLTRSGIIKRIDTLIGATVRSWCTEAGVAYPPSCVLLRVFKRERECEVWAGGNSGPLKPVKTLRVCAFDNNPGPKLVQGDGKTPEGFYSSNELYGSSYWFMWMRLTQKSIDEAGAPNDGSSFRLCINYPNPSDVNRTRRLRLSNTGGEICIHGNCVSAGCISFQNRTFMAVYYLAAMHSVKRNGPLQVHIFPFRFTKELKRSYQNNSAYLSGKNLVAFWNNIEEGYDLFNTAHRPLTYSYQLDKYTFRSVNQ